jgi:hypothetical protein
LLAQIEIQNMLKFTNSLHKKFGEVLEYGHADGVVFQILLLVQQIFDPYGVDSHWEIKQKSIFSRRVNFPMIK